MRGSLLAVALALLALAVYAQAAGFDFIRLDDPGYVGENPRVLAGITGDGIVWALTTTHRSNWHPLTWLSLMLDAEWGGGRPGPFHVTNVVLHLLATLVLFAALRRATGRDGPSAFVAALFAIHPLHVESVAWITERKDVLSTLFGFAALLAYVRWTEKPGWTRYALVAGALVLGLLSKPMLVTLPVALLFLDLWPLGRLDPRRFSDLVPRVVEKLPLLALCAASAGVTIWAQSRGGAVADVETFPMATRAANALVSYAAYLGKTVWPAGLALPYPYDAGSLTALRVGLSAALLLGITIVAVRGRLLRPYVLAGWLWYLVTLLPVIGLVQVGTQAMADRYTYLPLVGPFFAIAWTAADLAPKRAWIARTGASATIVVMAVLAWRQTALWRDGTTLFTHALRVTTGNATAHNVLGLEAKAKGRAGVAADHFAEAARLSPRWADARVNHAAALVDLGRFGDAAARYVEAEKLRPGDADIPANLGLVLIRMGRRDLAARRFEDALAIDPGNALAQKGLGFLLAQQGRDQEAVPHLREALRSSPEDPQTRINLAGVLLRMGLLDEAQVHLTEAIRLDPRSDVARTNLGVLCLRQGRREEAREHLREALRLNPDNETARRYLAE